ncbi:MAG: aldo/keto reductase, partial [Bdellovibrionales bacterium]|nr:aldo/keto reductase [Bdellovibrionales bacterium]
MQYNLLGQTGLLVSEICLGTMTFGGKGFWEKIGAIDQSIVNDLIKTAFDKGVNFIDTANVYSFGLSETMTGEALKKLGLPRDEMVIATKSTGIMDENNLNSRGQSRYHIMNAVDQSLQRLQLDHIDLYQIHGFDPLVPMEETLSTLNDLVRSGKIRYIGLCNLPAWLIADALAISERQGWSKFVSVQSYYTIAGRDLEREVIPLIQNKKLGLMVWSPLAGGLLSGKYDRSGQGPEGSRRNNFDFPVVDKERAFNCIDVMRGIAEGYNVSVAQIAQAWLLHQSSVTSIIVGAKRVDQLVDNIASTQIKLTEAELVKLNEVSQLPPEYPGWMIER